MPEQSGADGGLAGGGGSGSGGLAASGMGGQTAIGGESGLDAGTSHDGAAAGGGGRGTSSGGAGGRAGVGGGGGVGGTAATGGAAEMGGSPGSGGVGGGASAAAPRIVGRTAPGGISGSAQYSWPGVNIQAEFTGTQVSMTVNNATGNNRITVVVDSGMPSTLSMAAGQATVSLASGLTSGTHDLLIWRNTEASPGSVTNFEGLTGFSSGGTLLAPADAPSRRIEVIGDSLSVGAGVEGNSTCTGGIDAYTNNYLAYGSVASRAVSADVVTIAYSGIGVYRNYGETTPTATSLTMPNRYPYAIPDTVPWDFALYQPQVVIINLGTNDFGSGDPGTPYETAYVSFVQTVRGKYPETYFILIDMYGGNRLTRLNDILATLKSDGESKVEILSLESVQNNLGCNQHPNVAGQQAMGNALATRLRSVMGW
jgi:lysophospholipase L1-like esterase